MDFTFDESLVVGYKSNSQKIRIMSENWVAKNIYCPVCGNLKINKMGNNMPVADFQCDCCEEVFELKSKKGNVGKKISDGAYDTMINRITSISNPDLFVMEYTSDLQVLNLSFVPKFFFTPEIIEKRKPLSSKAQRAGWIGCNILYSDIPQQGRIPIINQSKFCDKGNVIYTYKQIKKLQINIIENRGWLFDVLNCVNNIKSEYFSITDIYEYVEMLRSKHIDNHNIEAKIRQQLQILRDKGFIEFIERGKYKKLI